MQNQKDTTQEKLRAISKTASAIRFPHSQEYYNIIENPDAVSFNSYDRTKSLYEYYSRKYNSSNHNNSIINILQSITSEITNPNGDISLHFQTEYSLTSEEFKNFIGDQILYESNHLLQNLSNYKQTSVPSPQNLLGSSFQILTKPSGQVLIQAENNEYEILASIVHAIAGGNCVQINLTESLASKPHLAKGFKNLADKFERVEYVDDELINTTNYEKMTVVGNDLVERPIGMIYGIGQKGFLHEVRSLAAKIERSAQLCDNPGRNVLVQNEYTSDLRILAEELVLSKRIMNGKKKDTVTHIFAHQKHVQHFINLLKLVIENKSEMGQALSFKNEGDLELESLVNLANPEEFVDLCQTENPNDSLRIFLNPKHENFDTTNYMGPLLIVNSFKSQDEMLLRLNNMGKINCIFNYGSAKKSNWSTEFYNHLKDTYYNKKDDQKSENTKEDTKQKILSDKDLALQLRPNKFINEGQNSSLINTTPTTQDADLGGWSNFSKFTGRNIVQSRRWMYSKRLTPPYNKTKYNLFLKINTLGKYTDRHLMFALGAIGIVGYSLRSRF